MDELDRDYAGSGMCIRQALVEAADRHRVTGSMPIPPSIVWGEHPVVTGDVWDVPARGRLTIKIESPVAHLRQGLELQVPRGGVHFGDGALTPRLHLWRDADLPDTVTYQYVAPERKILTCNIYEQAFGGRHKPRLERWGDWAGMWVEEISTHERVYHCNHGETNPPVFDDLVYRLTVD